MTRAEAQELAHMVRAGLPTAMMARLKAIHIAPKLHQGMLTIRIYMTNVTAEEPEAHIFLAEEI